MMNRLPTGNQTATKAATGYSITPSSALPFGSEKWQQSQPAEQVLVIEQVVKYKQPLKDITAATIP